MDSSFNKGDYVFVELNSPLNSKDIGLFSLNNEILIRKFYSRKGGKIILKPENKNYDEITLKDSDKFYIIGKVLG